MLYFLGLGAVILAILFEKQGISLILAAWKLMVMLDGKETKFNSYDNFCCVFQ
jgi:hypothetical protein